MSGDTNEQLLKVLRLVDEKEKINSLELSASLNLAHNSIIGLIKSLSARDGLIETETETQVTWELTDEGNAIVNSGSYEVQVFNYLIANNNAPLPDVMKSTPNAKIGFSKAMANGWIKIDKSNNTVATVVDNVVDLVKKDLENIKNNDFTAVSAANKTDYKKRKLIKECSITVYKVSKGTSFSLTLEKGETELTPDMISSGSWKTKTFKPYNFDAQGIQSPRGHLHPLLKIRDEFRRIFLELGYTEMWTSNYIASSFWNFDALFQPQQHPARDAHDTFFLQKPCETNFIPEEVCKKVATVHSKGAYGSIGYQYEWSIKEAKKNLLRTHTTVNSARTLYNLCHNKEFKPIKMFSIDRVFRNETLDATHLAEFNQIEGLIADYDLSLGDLIGVINQFFSKIGFDKVKFKPAYNPYTEPSMEIFCYHNGLQKWIEVGNSGMFRPEMLLTLGLPPNVNVIAWGLSVERPAMIKYHFNNIRDLVGPKVQLSTIYDDPIAQMKSLS
ncbi:phenylalanine--tRNA ligase alpha subunit [Halyomorpha halys]|uniref:phenylalanine--tRNA ligase alpha subunit n=1 Tax=Halyomorpha halys TaxID=286706 RepID=UPI0006D4EE84|nr:phenylalanine--tRNA ligase alpha subunit [Halyomorpha halys]